MPRSLDKDARDLIDKLLEYTPENRIGMQGYDEVKQHPYFKGIDFEKLHARKLPVPSKEVFNVSLKTMGTESDESAFSMTETKMTLSRQPEFVVKHMFDACCRSKIDLDKIVMESLVKVRRKLFFYKRRQMVLLEDGSVFIVKHGHISNEIKLAKNTEIAH